MRRIRENGETSWTLHVNKPARMLCRTYERLRLSGKSFALVSNNCWGYELYGVLGREYNTPFVGLFVPPDSYVRLLENFDDCLHAKLEFSDPQAAAVAARYPVGQLGAGVEIHFLHYASADEARAKWERRTARLRVARAAGVPLYLKLCDRDGCTSAHLARFHALPFGSKVSIGVRAFDSPHHLCRPELKDPGGDCVVDGVKLYAQRYRCFDVAEWIARGCVTSTVYSRILARFS